LLKKHMVLSFFGIAKDGKPIQTLAASQIPPVHIISPPL
jgi:hypothetical protein